MYEGIKFDINNPNFGTLGSHKRYGDRFQNKDQWWESPEAKRAQQIQIGKHLAKWNENPHPADTMGGIVRYGFPAGKWQTQDISGRLLSGKGSPGWVDTIMREVFKQQLEKQYPDYDWRKSPRPIQASEAQKKLPPPHSQEYTEYLRTGILPEKG